MTFTRMEPTSSTVTHSSTVFQQLSEAWPYGHERRGHNPAHKNSDETGAPCTYRKVCNSDTVDDSVQSRTSEGKERNGNTGYG